MSWIESMGVLSGTSVDAVDVVWVGFDEGKMELRATHSHPITPALREKVFGLMGPSKNELVHAGRVDRELGLLFAQAIMALWQQEGIGANDITVIGSHGQTVRHHPDDALPFTWQLGDPNTIVAQTGCPVVADFRRRDVAEGGQGAPLAPAFHRSFLCNKADAVLNLGGMANLSVLSLGLGFDTGPGNGLLDLWCRHHTGQVMDEGGVWSSQGRILEALLEQWLRDPFFAKRPPKSTGKEYFNMDWIRTFDVQHEKPCDVQATLVALTAQSIAHALQPYAGHVNQLMVCGGGVFNPSLMQALQVACAPLDIELTKSEEAAWLEGMLFAWLAALHWAGDQVDWSSITGGRKATLGALYRP